MQIVSRLLIGVFLLLLGSNAFADELAQHQASHSNIRLLLERDKLAIGETNWIAIQIEPREGWHTYWQNPGDSGAAPIFTWTAPDGISFGEPSYGAPEKIPVAHLMNYGFSGPSTILIPVRVAAALPEKSFDISLDAEWLVCEQECVPQLGIWDLTLTTAANAKTTLTTRDVFVEARANVPELTYWDSELIAASVSSELRIFADASELAGLKSAYYFPKSEGVANYAGEQIWSLDENGLLLRLPRDRSGVKPTVAHGILHLEFENSATKSVSLTPKLEIANQLSSGGSDVQIGGMPIWKAGIYALFGGIILNLMPCVFPILSLKAFAFVASNYKTASNRRREGWAYTFGIWVSFMVIVAALLGLKSGGAAIGWGFQLQEPLFVGLLAILMVLVSLSLAGLFTIRMGFEGAGEELASREGAQGAFFKGVLATLVATPCTAPLMAPAIGFALTQSTATVILVFSLLAFGLALPFLLLSYSARVAAAMPKPGPWMEKVKQGLAFPMLLTAAWLIYVFDLQAGPTATLVLLVVAIFVSFSIWLWGQSAGSLARGIAAIIFIVSLWGLISFAATSNTLQNTDSAENEQTFSEANLNALLNAQKPVFVYFTAEWCITCKVNEKIALDQDNTRAAFTEHGVTVLKGDWTNRNDEIATVLARYGRAGVPLYLYFPAGVVEAIILPEILTTAAILEVL